VPRARRGRLQGQPGTSTHTDSYIHICIII
jgi:hypothetical protein